MAKEQEEVIRIIEERIIEPFYEFPNPLTIELSDKDVIIIESALKLIKEKDKENIILKKQIDFMADCIAYGGSIHKGEPGKIKQYFEMKAKYECKRQN